MVEAGFLAHPERNELGFTGHASACSALCLRGPDVHSGEARVCLVSLQGSRRAQIPSHPCTPSSRLPPPRGARQAPTAGKGLSPSCPGASVGNEDKGRGAVRKDKCPTPGPALAARKGREGNAQKCPQPVVPDTSSQHTGVAGLGCLFSPTPAQGQTC